MHVQQLEVNMSVIPVLGGDGSTSNSRRSNWMHVERLGSIPDITIKHTHTFLGLNQSVS